jgi:hypothetical protein
MKLFICLLVAVVLYGVGLFLVPHPVESPANRASGEAWQK